MKRRLLLLLLCFAVHVPAAADAPVDLLNANNKVYVADINADGCPDHLLSRTRPFAFSREACLHCPRSYDRRP
jgi:hypothetical protein